MNSIKAMKDYLSLIPRGYKEYSEELRKLHSVGNRKIDQYIADFPELPLDILDELVNSKNDSIRAKAANSPNLTKDQILKLLEDCSLAKTWLAQNKNVEAWVLETLSKDGSTPVRANVAKNECTPEDVLDYLSKDENATVRLYVAKNPRTSVHTLDFLAKDPLQIVAKAAIENLNLKKK